MKNTIKTFLTLFAVSLVFAGCTQNLGVGNGADKITLNGSIGINGAVPSALFNASSENSAGRTAVSSGKLYYGYSFSLAAENESTGEEVSAMFKTEFGKENEFTIKLEKAKYKLSLCIIDSEKNEYGLNVSKIVLGKNTSSGATLDLTDDSVDLKSEKIAIYFAPSVETGNVPSPNDDTIIMSTGQGSVNLTLKSTCTENSPDRVEYEYMRMPDDVLDTTAFTSGIASTEFKGETAIINTSFPLANGVYRFTISIYDKDENLLVTTRQTVNVFAGFVTDTWLDSGSKFLVTENGVTSFVLTDDLIKADELEPEPAEPNTYYVMAAGYETNIVWGEGNDENSGTSPEEPLATLQAAVDKIIEINDSQTEYKISVMGTMKPTEVVVEETTSYKLADFNGLDKDVNLNVKIVGRENAVLDAEEKCSAIFVGVVGAETNLLKVNLTLEGLEIKNGKNSNSGGGVYFCGASEGSSLTIKDCKITNNTAGYYYGGGVYVYNKNTLKILDSEISGNKTVTEKGDGGGVYVGNESTVEIENCEFSNNEAELANGGVIFANYSTLTIKDCKFANNKSGHADGGAIFAYQSTLTVKGGEFTENFAYRDGGAIYLQGGQLTVNGGTITGNKATNGNGGGIYVNQNSSLEISDVTITGNTATGEGNNIYVEAGGSYTGPEFDEDGLYSGSGNVSPVYGNMSFNLVTLIDDKKGKIEVIDGVYQLPMKTDISFVLEQDGEEIVPSYSSIWLLEENNALPVVEGSSDSQFVLSPENAFFSLYKGNYDISKKYLLRVLAQVDFIYYDWEFEAKIVQTGTAN